MTECKPNIKVISINVTRLNLPIQRTVKLALQNFSSMLYTRGPSNTLIQKDYSEVMDKDLAVNENNEKAPVKILIPDQVLSKPEY